MRYPYPDEPDRPVHGGRHQAKSVEPNDQTEEFDAVSNGASARGSNAYRSASRRWNELSEDTGAHHLPEDSYDDEPEPAAPPARLGSTAAAMVALGLAGAMVLAGDSPGFLLAIVAGAQLLALATWWWGARVQSLGFAVVGVAVAVGADLVANRSEPAPAGLALVIAGGFGLAILTQLARKIGRRKVAAALASQVSIAVVIAGLATTVLLVRSGDGLEVARTAIFSAGVALAAAHCADLFLVRPRVHRRVPRGLLGLLAGALTGLAAGVVFFGAIGDDVFAGVSTSTAGATIGIGAAVVALLADLAVSYSVADGESLPEADPDAMKLSPGHQIPLALLAPIVGFSAVGPIGYLLEPMLQQW